MTSSSSLVRGSCSPPVVRSHHSRAAISSVSAPYQPTHNVGAVAQAVFTSRLGQWLTSALAARKPAWLVRALLRGESTLTQEDIDSQAAHLLRTPAALEWLR